MKILILHNQLWSQYKSIIFENINNLCNKNGDELLVLQTSISEISRKDLIDFDINSFNYHYNFILLNNKYLESDLFDEKFNKTFLFALMDWLEKTKQEMKSNEVNCSDIDFYVLLKLY